MGNPAAIPLSGIAPPQQNAFDTYAKLMGIRAAQQEMQTRELQQQGLETQNEMQQLQLQSVKGLMAASKGVDWSQPDAFNTFIGNAQQHGVDPRMITPLVMERQKYLNELAQTDNATLKAHAEANNQALGYIDGMKGADPATKQLKARQALQAGVVRDPTMQQFLQATAAGDLNPTDDQISNVTAGLLDHTTQANLLIKQREAVAQEQSAQARAASAQTSAARLQAELPGGPLSPAARAQQTLPYTIQGKTDPRVIEAERQIASARGEAYAKLREYPVYDANTKQTVYMTPDELNAAKAKEPGRYTAPQYTPEQIAGQEMARNTGQVTKPLTAFNTAIQHLSTLSRLANDLGNSNVQIANRAKQRWAQETGNPAPVNFQAAVNAMSGEVAAALKQSGATDQEIREVGNTFSRAQSPQQLQGAINTYRELLTSKRGQLYQQYKMGAQGKPAFENQPAQPKAAPAVGTIEQGYRFKGGDPSKADNWEKQ